MAGPAEIVSRKFDDAKSYADAATANLTTFTGALDRAIYSPPTVNMAWAAPSDPGGGSGGVGDPPAVVNISVNLPDHPGGLNEQAPALTPPGAPPVGVSLNFPTAPTLTFGTVPEVPGMRDVAMPDAPQLPAVPPPQLLALETVRFSGVDMHEDWLQSLQNRPSLHIIEPTPYRYTRGEEYASELLAKLKAVLSERLNGGTGLPPAVEFAIWDRARTRETNLALANEQEIMRTHEALGFPLPPGVLAAQLRSAQQEYYDKLSGLSRDVAIKQAEMEQANLKEAIATGMQLEAQLLDYAYKLESLAFEDAKAAAENAIARQRAELENFQGLLRAYETFASVYKTIIDGQLAKVEVYKAQLQGEQTKADINRAKVEEFKALIDAGMSQVEIYKAQLGAAQTLVGLEEARIGVVTEQIKAFVAQTNVETAKVEAYKVGVQAEQIKQESAKTAADIYAAQAGVQAEHARVQIARFQAIATAKSAEWEGFSAAARAEAAVAEAKGRAETARMEGYKAKAAAEQAKAEISVKRWEASIAQYAQGQQLAAQVAKYNMDALQVTNANRLDAAKAGAQVYAQLAASAYSMVSAQAQISGDTRLNYSAKWDGSGPIY